MGSSSSTTSILGLTLSGASLSFLYQSSRGVTQVQARAAAEACMAELAERIVTDGEFGIAGTPEETIRISFPDCEAYLTFNEGEAASLGVPCSTNNRYWMEPETGKNGEIVPPFSVQAYCLGRSGDTEVVFELVLRAPEFPYVIASSGPVQSEGALVVGAAESPETADSESLLATALASNGDVDIRGRAQFFGDLTAAGEIRLADSVELRGEARPNSASVALENLSIPDLRPEESIPLESGFAPRLSGSVHHNGPSLTISGGLTLDDAVLYVNGDTRILGGVKGKGAIVVNGSLTLEGSSSLVAEDQIALVVQDDLSIIGEDQDSSFFQGLVYTEGDFYTEDVTLLGAFVANRRASPTEPGSRIQMRNTTLVYVEEYARFDLETNGYLVWGDGNKEHSGGRETLYLIEIDTKKADVLDTATTQTITSFAGAEGEASDNNGGSGSEGSMEGSVSTDNAAILAVARARKATVENGKLVSEWEEVSRDDTQGPSELLELLNLVNPATTFSGPTRLRFRPTAGPGPAPLKGFKAEPGSVFLTAARASFHQDLNDFLGAASRLKVGSVREVKP